MASNGTGNMSGSFRKMKGAVLRQVKGKMSIEDILVQKPKFGEVLIKNTSVGVCHTDLHGMEGHIAFPIPAVFGHEVSGVIEEINCSGEGSRGLKVGDRVVATFIMPCGSCYYCENGLEDICDTFFSHNRLKGSLYDGKTRLYTPKSDGSPGEPIAMYSMAGLAEYSVCPINGVYKLPESVPATKACILGCAIFTAYGAVKNAGMSLGGRPGATVVVIGTGGVGSNVIQVCKAFGASKIIAVDIDDSKLEFAKTMGATHVINSRKSTKTVPEQVVEIVGKAKGGADVAFEVLGNPITFNDAVLSVCDGGRAVMVGIAPLGTFAKVDITRLVRRKITIVGSYGAKARTDTPEVIDLIERGALSLGSITKVYSLDQAANAYDDLKNGRITGKAIIKL